jgi:ubiquinone/menaquinone biosynthesis C-methylase UbiE
VLLLNNVYKLKRYSDIKMSETSPPKTKNLHESTWDHHGSYQWTYFPDEMKQRIKFFLNQRLNGNNIELGGGWYLSYPNSVVVDLSSVCLENNPAKEKLHFDLDTIGEGHKLPYKDNSFDSATMISVWQYLKQPQAVIQEIERILKPGAELYLINKQNAGLEECIEGRTTAKDIQLLFQELKYDTLIENIPTFDSRLGSFESVCIAMPSIDLFENSSRIKDKSSRIEKNKEIHKDPSLFTIAYADWEMRQIHPRLIKLSSFPITACSIEYKARIESFSKEYHKKTGGIAVIFIEYGFEPELAMLTPDYNSLDGTIFLMNNETNINDGFNLADGLLKEFGLNFIRHMNYFRQTNTSQLLDYCTDFIPNQSDLNSKNEIRKFTNFISALSLNSFTSELQDQIYSALKPNIPDLDIQIRKQKASSYHMAVHEYKQKRNIDKLIDNKEKLMSGNTPLAGTQSLEYSSILSDLRTLIR